MKYANFRLLPKMSVNRLEDPFVVTHERWNVVFSKIADGIPTMVAQVIDDQVEFAGQE